MKSILIILSEAVSKIEQCLNNRIILISMTILISSLWLTPNSFGAKGKIIQIKNKFVVIDKGKRSGFRKGGQACIFKEEHSKKPIACGSVKKVSNRKAILKINSPKLLEQVKVGQIVLTRAHWIKNKREIEQKGQSHSPRKQPSTLDANFDFVATPTVSYYFTESTNPNKVSIENQLKLEPKFSLAWSERGFSVNVVGFYLHNLDDETKTHGDIKEFQFLYRFPKLELSFGITEKFWGVTESQNIIDVINQKDYLIDFGYKKKLGQPLAGISYFSDFGTLDLYALPLFRPARFPGKDSRFGLPLEVDYEKTQYESEKEDKNLDLAIRYSTTFKALDLGISHFTGTNREPKFVLIGLDIEGRPIIAPKYQLMDQSGVDMQLTLDSTMLKLESIYRTETESTLTSYVLGLEYVIYSFISEAAELSLILEYSDYDFKPKESTDETTSKDFDFFEKFWFFAMRYSLNNTSNTELLLSVASDRESSKKVGVIEINRRFFESIKIHLEYRSTSGIAEDDPFYELSLDNVVKLKLESYF